MHGRYSTKLPKRLLETYQESLKDPELLAMREEISLLDARLGDLLGRVDTGESLAAWKSLATAYAAARNAQYKKDTASFLVAMNDIGSLIEGGLSDYAAWHEIQSLVDQRRKVVESERRRLIEMEQVVTAELAMAYMGALTEAVRRHVADRVTLAKIQDEFARLTASTNH